MIKECNLCWWEVKLFNPSEVYWPRFKHYNDSSEKPWERISFIYKCLKCSATVWCHKNTKKPFWTLADKETRNARHLCHNLLDPIWKKEKTWNHNKWSRGEKRKELYKLLSEYMKIDFNKTHFWMFSIEQCRIAYKFFLNYKKENNIK